MYTPAFTPSWRSSVLFGTLLAVSATAWSAVTYPQPIFSGFTPTSGGVGTVITMNGTGFTGLNSAWLGSARDATVTVISDTQAKVTVPSDGATGQIAVLNPQHAAFTPASFTVTKAATGNPQPIINSFTPTSGIVGTVITITGSGFTGSTGGWIGTAHDATLNVVSDSTVKFTVPKDAVTGQLAVLNPQHAAFSPASFTVAVAAAAAQPKITAFAPASGVTGSGITVTGSGFTGLTSAWVGAGHDARVSVVSDTQATVTVPADAATGAIQLLNSQHSTTSSGYYTVTPPSNGTGSGKLSVRVQGNHFIDANSVTVQLRGVNASGLEFTAVQGWSPADPWGGVSPNFAAIKTWKSNTVRLPLNEASWLGYLCVDGTGATRNPDPGKNYRATVAKAVADATAAGLYVIVDLHWTAPKNFCPLAQNPMADTDNSLNFWTSVATTFKGYPNVLFELFNEPYLYWLSGGEVDWKVLMQGGTETQYVTGDAAKYTANYTWTVAGMQQMLNAVRATGATNVVLVAGVSWAQDLSQWVANKPTDPLQQMAAVWHAYPNSGTVGDPQAALPKFGAIGYTWTQSVLTAGYPVLITEFGDHDAAGTVGAPFVSNLLPWADAHGASYTGWTWDPWGDADNVLTKDAAGTPTDGYGVYTKAHFLCAATGSSNCP